MPFPSFQPTIPNLIRIANERFGSSPFLLVDGERLSFAEADERSSTLARALLGAGIGKGSRVGLLLPNSVDFVIAALGTARIGAVFVPVNTFYKVGELRAALGHADLTDLFLWSEFLDASFVERLEEAFPELPEQEAGALRLAGAPYLRRAYVWRGDVPTWASGGQPTRVDAPAAMKVDDVFLRSVETCVVPSDPAVIIYTSGSTSEPKGVVHSHGAVVRHSCNVQSGYPMTPDDVLFSTMPFFWIGGLICGLFETMHVGNELVTMSAFEAGSALDVIETERVTVAQGWPHQGKTLSEHRSFPGRDRSAIRRSMLVGLALPEHELPEHSSTSLGMTEMCSSHLLWDPYEPLQAHQHGAFGKSMEGIQHKVIDPITGVDVPIGEDGELCARGYSLMLGLHRREREDVFDHDGWYHTGDAGHFDDDGFFHFIGRLTEMIKTPGGANVAPPEVEGALMEYPEVLEAYVTGIPGDDDGQYVVAAVVPRGDATIDPDELRKRLRRDLSAFKVPRYLWVCPKSELPFLESGKIKKSELGTMIARQFAGS